MYSKIKSKSAVNTINMNIPKPWIPREISFFVEHKHLSALGVGERIRFPPLKKFIVLYNRLLWNKYFRWRPGWGFRVSKKTKKNDPPTSKNAEICRKPPSRLYYWKCALQGKGITFFAVLFICEEAEPLVCFHLSTTGTVFTVFETIETRLPTPPILTNT